ncbi:hypothetical protein C8R47DRAFT_178196 [Mycena vitilis]|nr:hypothetical protein C8R47DRAFT_178196 [Mycena vitilis]
MPRTIESVSVFTRKKVRYVDTTRASTPSDASKVANSPAIVAVPLKTRRRLAGYLSGVLVLPLDVLAEILTLLTPLDLLHLAWTSKALRAYIMSRSNAFVWKASRAMVGMPPCPAELTEPQYAYLAFVSTCHGPDCNKVCQLIIWQFRARYCKKCLEAKTTYVSPYLDMMEKLAKIWSHVGPGTELFPNIPSRLHTRRTQLRYQIQLYQLSDLNDFFLKFHAIPAQDFGAMETLYRAHKAKTAAINEHAKLCGIWLTSTRRMRFSDLNAVYRRRQAAIRAKLEDLGWGEEINRLGWAKIKDGHNALREYRDLTERIWNKISAAVIQYIKDCVWEDLDCKHYFPRRWIAFEVWANYRASLPADDVTILPPSLDVVFHPIFLAVIEAPPDTVVDTASFDAVIPKIPQVIAEWRADAEARLAKILLPASEPVAALKLAKTVATCRVCHCSFVYPAILTHGCFTRFYAPKDLRPDEAKYAEMYRTQETRMWTCEGFIRASDSGDAIRELLRVCGAEYETASVAEVDERNPIMSCVGCAHLRPMNWRAAVNHTTSRTHAEGIQWRRELDGTQVYVEKDMYVC